MMKKSRAVCLVIIFLFSLTAITFGQSDTDIIDFDSDKWDIADPNGKIEPFLFQKSLYLSGGQAYLKDVEFENGTIEVDIASHGFRGFGGIIFRVQAKTDYEVFYIRPHKSGLPDAVQYTPVFNGLSEWQLYSNEGFIGPIDIPVGKWIHLKMVIDGERADVYWDDMDEPAFVIPELKHGKSKGTIGLYGFLGSMHFANFKYSNKVEPLKQPKSKPVITPPGTIKKWKLSEPFDFDTFVESEPPSEKQTKSLKWKKVESEKTGLINVSRYHPMYSKMVDGKKQFFESTVFAKMTIESKSDQIRKLSIGYSDKISIFLNNKILFSASSLYRTRDPGFLGIISPENDAVYLDLKKGKNELLFAVSESFGGWGFIAKLDKLDGIKLK